MDTHRLTATRLTNPIHDMTSTLKSTTNWVLTRNKKIPPKSEHQTRRNLRPRHIPKQDT